MDVTEIFNSAKEYIKSLTFLELNEIPQTTHDGYVLKNKDGFIVATGISLSLNGERSCVVAIDHDLENYEIQVDYIKGTTSDKEVREKIYSMLEKHKYFIMIQRERKINDLIQ